MSTYKRLDLNTNQQHIQQTPVRFNGQQGHSQTEFISAQKSKYDSASTRLQSFPHTHQTNFDNQHSSTAGIKADQMIFENNIQVRIKSYEREEFNTFLNIKMFTTQHSTQGLLLNVELTDESNLLEINESQFLQMKHEQDINLDYHGYPSMLIEFLNLCEAEEQGVKYTCFFEIKNQSEGQFSIKETNKFKNNTHVNLNFRAASDESLKNFLSDKLYKEKLENNDFRIRNKQLDEEVAQLKNNLHKASDDLRRELESKQRELQDLASNEKAKFTASHSQWQEKETSIISNYSEQLRERQNAWEREKNKLQDQLENFSNQNKQLEQAKFELERQESQQSKEIQISDKSLKKISQDNETLRDENRKLSNIQFEIEKKISGMTVKIESLEQVIQDKEKSILDNKELVESAREKKSLLDGKIKDQEEKIKKLEKKLIQATEEIKKGNESIDKLESEFGKRKQKIKDRDEIIQQQEAKIDKQNITLDDLRKESLDIRKEKDRMENDIETYKKDLEFKENKLKEAKESIQENENTIKYLSTQLTEAKTGRNFSSNTRMTYGRYAENEKMNTSNVNHQRVTSTVDSNYDRYNQQTPINATHQKGSYAQTLSKSPISKYGGTGQSYGQNSTFTYSSNQMGEFDKNSYNPGQYERKYNKENMDGNSTQGSAQQQQQIFQTGQQSYGNNEIQKYLQPEDAPKPVKYREPKNI